MRICSLCANFWGMTQLKSFLAKSGIKQAVLAAELGISKGYMSELVSGDKAPGRELAVRIEKATLGAVSVMIWDHPHPSVPTPAPKQEGVKG